MTQTSVEFIVEKLTKIGVDFECNLISKSTYLKKRSEYIDIAKKMEKDQIVDAATWGALAETGEKYYKEKYKKD
jgi:hypothetical protein